jgi:serine/threonine-protein kinase
MEVIEGEDVEEMLRRRGPLPPREAAAVAVHAAGALEHAHRHGVVHGDVKPSNLMITLDGRLKVTDFGLARVIEAQRTTSWVAGTPAYMAPEHLAGRRVDARADVFSLAASLYEMLTAALPFDGLERSRPPAPPSSHRPDVPDAVDAAVLRGLALDPSERFASAAAFAEAVRLAVGGG